MSLHRFFVPAEGCAESRIHLPDSEAHHAWRVLRVRPGDRATVLDGQGGQFLCRISEASGREVILEVLEKLQAPEPDCRVTLFQAIPKGKILDSIIQKATELGVTRILPIITEHVVARPDERDFHRKQEKWQTVAIEAVKQCGQPWLPLVEAPVPLEHALRGKEELDLELIGALSGEARHPRAWFSEFSERRSVKPRSAGVWIGPEGDFTATELKAIIQSGACPITLGPLVLRCETAAIYCLSVIRYETSFRQEPD